ncbi:hypothetical protein D049_3569B, partial [Vibrio parahaemolyticus VPTS-2010]
VQRPTEFG